MEEQMFQLWPWKLLDQIGQPWGMRTPLTHKHTHTGLTRLENMHNENPDCMFFSLRGIIVHPHGFAGAVDYVTETRASRCRVLSNHWNNFQMIVAVWVQASIFLKQKCERGEKAAENGTRQSETERGPDKPRISAPECDCGPNGPA